MGTGHFEEHEEEYMETLYEFYEERGDSVIKNGEIAKALNVSPASATEMIQRLAKRGYLIYQPYKGARLTADGLSMGRKMKRRHRLAKTFLAEVLQFQGDVDEAACRIEHAIDDELEWTLDELLGRPENDSDGKPIPPPEKRFSPFENQPLKKATTLGNGDVGIISVIATPPSDRDELSSMGVSIGSEIINTGSGWKIDGLIISIDEKILSKVLVRAQPMA